MATTTPLDAYPTAYDALAGTPAESDDEFRQAVAHQIVDTLMQLRTDRGLSYLRGMGATASYHQAKATSEQFGHDPELLVGRAAMHRAYEATAAVIVDAFARPKR